MEKCLKVQGTIQGLKFSELLILDKIFSRYSALKYVSFVTLHGDVPLCDRGCPKHLVWFPCPNVGQASTNRDLRLDAGACFSCIVTNFSH